MAALIGVAALIAVVFWLFVRRRPRATPAPEDEVETPVDEALLAEAASRILGFLLVDPRRDRRAEWNATLRPPP